MDLASIRRAPKVLLHDHLDGGLRPRDRPRTRRARCGYDGCPRHDADELAHWFREPPTVGFARALPRDVRHTVAVMQTRGGADAGGARVRRGPRRRRRRLRRGALGARAAPRARARPRRGRRGRAATASARGAGGRGARHPIRVGCLLTAMRHAARSLEIAELAVRYRDQGVVGFDIAGAEAGYPPTRHLDAFEYMRAQERTLHDPRRRGVRAAVDLARRSQCCGADRLGHGVRIVDDITRQSDGGRRRAVARPARERTCGTSGSRWRCAPSSNVQTGAAQSHRGAPDRTAARAAVPGHGQHRQPADERYLDEPGDAQAGRRRFGYGWSDLQWFTINAMKWAFIPFDERLGIIDDMIKPGYAVLIG